MTAHAPNFFGQGWLNALSIAASNDDFVARHSSLADLKMGFRNTETGEVAWIRVDEASITAGCDDPLIGTAFTFAGDTAAFDALRHGFPFNRLVRQHRLVVEGDMRNCVQNWLLIYAVTRLASGVEN